MFRGNSTTLIPGSADSSWVLKLNDNGLVLAWSADPTGLNQNIYRVFRREKQVFEYQLPTGSDCTPCWDVNTHGVIAGQIYDPSVNAARAVRFKAFNKAPTPFVPPAPDSSSESFGITESGTMGIKTSVPGVQTLRYGLLDKKGRFTLYFDGPVYQTLLNDKELIVLTWGDNDVDSYILPAPGVRQNIEHLIDNPEDLDTPIKQITAINTHGDMVGFDHCDTICPTFLLQRVNNKHRH